MPDTVLTSPETQTATRLRYRVIVEATPVDDSGNERGRPRHRVIPDTALSVVPAAPRSIEFLITAWLRTQGESI